jgi:hypothetical protein
VQPADESDRKQADIDLIAAKSKKERILVRCRDWEKNSVELTTVKNIKAATTGLNATSAAIYTTGTFPTDCRDFASTKNVELIDAHGTLARIAEIVASAPDSTPTPAANPLLSHSETGEIHPMDVRRTATTEAAKPQRIIFVDAEAVRTGGDLVTQVLERHPGFSLVASSHGEGDEEHLRTAITGATIIGSTPDMTGMPGKTRFLEITQFLETTAAPTAIWAAIDTNPQLFPEATIELVLVTSERGFTHGAAERLSETLRLGVQRIRLADSTNPSINSGAGCVKRWATNA